MVMERRGWDRVTGLSSWVPEELSTTNNSVQWVNSSMAPATEYFPVSNVSQNFSNGVDTAALDVQEGHGPRNEALVVWEIVTLAAIFLLTVLGNIVVLFMLLSRRKKLTRMCYFILSLCVSDLITAFLNVLPQLVWEITYRFRGGSFLCKAVKFCQLLGPYLNSYLLVMTALDRYQVICYPLSNCSWTPRRSKRMIYLAWVLALGSCTPQLFVFSYQQVDEDTWDCWASFTPPWGMRAYVTWYALSVFIIPLIFLVFAYSYICRTLWANFKHKQRDEPHQRWPDLRRSRLLVQLKNPGLRVDSSSDVSTSTIPRSAMEDNTVPLLHASTPRLTVPSPNMNRESRRGPRQTTNPRVHSIRGIGRAKIKTVKLTVTVIFCYITCSAPFISVQLWHVWDPHAASSPFYSGAAFTILMLLASLNSVVNPWIFLTFNENLWGVAKHFCACSWPSMRGALAPSRSRTFRSSDSNKNIRLTVFTTTEADQAARNLDLSSHRDCTTNLSVNNSSEGF